MSAINKFNHVNVLLTLHISVFHKNCILTLWGANLQTENSMWSANTLSFISFILNKRKSTKKVTIYL